MRHKCRVMRPPFSFPRKKTGVARPKERRFPLQASSSKSCNACRLLLPARGVAAFEAAIRFASAPIIRCCAAVGGSAALRMRHTPCGCRSAHLVGVRSNFRLPPVPSMRRAQQCRYFARSLPPRKRHSRLTTVRRGCCQITIRRDSWRSHVHRTHTAQRVQPFKLQTRNGGVKGEAPLPFSGGSKGGVLFGKRTPPLTGSSAYALHSPSAQCAEKTILPARQPPFTPLGVKQLEGVLCQKNS